MKNLSSRFAKVRRIITKGDTQLAIALLNDLQKDITEKFSANIKAYDALQMHRRSGCLDILAVREISEVEVVIIDTATSKITLSPSEKRCTLKITDKASELVKNDLIKIAKYIKTQPIYWKTLRGKIIFVSGCYEVVLITDNKHYAPISFSFTKEQLENL